MKAVVPPPWTRIDASSDKPERLLVGFVVSSDGATVRDSADGHMYVVKVSADVPKDQISDDELTEANKEKQLASGASRFLDDTKVEFHGAAYRRLRFVTSGKRGDICLHLYFRRTGEWSITVQCGYPYDAKLVETGEMSPMLKEFDRGVSLFDEEPGG